MSNNNEKLGWAWSCIFDAFYQLKDRVPKYYNLLGWTIEMRNKNNATEYATICCYSENQDPLPLARWFGTDTTNTTMDDLKELFDKFDTFNIVLTFRNNGVEIQETQVIELIRNTDPIDLDSVKTRYYTKPKTGIFLKNKKNESADSIQEDKQECITPET